MINLFHKVCDSNVPTEELLEHISITNTTINDKDDIVKILTNCFDLTPNEVNFQMNTINVDFENSVKVVDKRNNDIYGLLILCHFNIINGSPILNYMPITGNILGKCKHINGHSFILDKRLRGMNIDKQMLQHCQNFTSQFKFIWCGVENDLKSHNYWKRLGFVECLDIGDAKFYIKSTKS